MIRPLLAACALAACHSTPTVDVEFHVVDGGPPAIDSGADFLATGTMAAGLAVAIDVSSSGGVVTVTSTDSTVLEVVPTTTGTTLIVAHAAGNATLDFTVDGELARSIPVVVFAQ